MGDVLLCTNYDVLSIGDTALLHVGDRKVDIVHRVVELQHLANGSVSYLFHFFLS